MPTFVAASPGRRRSPIKRAAALVTFLVTTSFVLGHGAALAQTLIYAQSDFPSTLDSADSHDGYSLSVSSNVTETLIAFEAGSTALAPGLATAWRANEDATVWTLELREGVAFHDGTPFDAEAVKFNFDRWNDPSHPYGFRDEGKSYVAWGWVFGGARGDGGLLDEVRVRDEHVVELVLTEPVGLLPSMLAALYFQIDSPTAVMEAGADYGTPSVGSVGTGPFAFVSWVEGDRLTLRRNDAYWGDVAKVDRVVFRAIADPTARLAELLAGTIDIAVNLAPDDLATIESDPRLVPALAASELVVGYLGLHQSNEPFDDPTVRRAVAHAIDRDAIVDAFYAGLGSVSHDFLPPTLWGRADLEPYPYDPERARALLAEAGYPDGFATELWYLPVGGPIFPSPRPMAEAMASYLSDVGIQAALKTEDLTTYLADFATGAFPMYMLGWFANYADPDNFLHTFFGPTAPEHFGWDDPTTRDLLTRARRASDREERTELYARALQRVNEAVPAISLVHTSSVHATTTAIDGFRPSPLGPALAALNHVTKR